MPNKTPH